MKEAGRLRRIRLISAAVVFPLFLFAAFSSSLPAELLSRLLSRLQFIPAILRSAGIPEAVSAAGAAGEAGAAGAAGAAANIITDTAAGSVGSHTQALISAVSGGAAALIILVSAFLFGRVYCSFLCPLGLFQDVFIESRRKTGAGILKNGGFRHIKPNNLIRYGILFICTAAVITGIMIPLILLEPFSIWGRMTTDILHPLAVSANRLLFYALRPFGIFITLISYNFNLPVFSVTFLTVSLIVFFTIKKGRIYCSLVCPAGTLLSLLSCYSVNRVVIDPSLCTSCGLCGKKCRTGCIDSSGRTVDNSRCVMCGDCLTGCPAGAIGLVKSKAVKYTAQTISRKGRGSFDKSRRSFLSRIKLYSGASLSALLIPSWLTMRKRTLTPTGEKNTPSTPPGSKGVSHFTARCISCHRCVSLCPTNVLQPSLFEYGIKGMLQPVMDYRSGYCEFECTACTRACPSGAIIPITIERKKTIQIGRVYFEKDKCIVVTNGTICGACAEGCPTHAVGMEPYKNNLDIPVTDNSICIGCGSCENICPVPEKAIYVKGLEIHGTAEVREPLYKAPKESANEGFPF